MGKRIISSSKLSNAFIDWLVNEETEKKLSILIQTLNINKDFIEACNKFQDESHSIWRLLIKNGFFGDTNSNTDLSMVRNSNSTMPA